MSRIDELQKFKELLIDYSLTLNKIEETHEDYEAFKPVRRQIRMFEDITETALKLLQEKPAGTPNE